MVLLIILLAASVFAEFEPTTTRTYDIEVPGSDPIRIVEGEPLWKNERRNYGSDDREDALQQFLTKYAEDVNRNKNSDDKKKSWDLMQYQRHNHPYDDKKGWVSMEPVPWSISKISKWQSKYKVTTPRPWEDYDSQEVGVRPSWNRPTTNNYDNFYPDDNKPSNSRPGAVYSHKVHVNYPNNHHQNNRYQQHTHDENCNHHNQPLKPLYDDGEIITDGLPSNFPMQPYEAHRRFSSDLHPETHPLGGEGEWVLLSTTKGYKYPQKRQRALQVKPETVGAHRGVRLTVLPPAKNSKVNMTTSHGGLLQVESTFQTVEQSQKQYVKKLNQKKKLQNNKPKPVKAVPAPTVTTTKRNTGPDSSAVLAAVGAGMIPATMAMLVPMALGGRRKREVPINTPKYKFKRNLY